MRQLSRSAQCAKAIRTELKSIFPTIKFSVTSDNFSMGDSVDIRWNNGPTATEVKAITDKYQYGHFNGMIDMYEHTNTRTDIPQSKYVSTRRDTDNGMTTIVVDGLRKLFTEEPPKHELERLAYNIISNTSLPFGAEVVGVKEIAQNGRFEDCYTLDYNVPETVTVEPKGTIANNGEVSIVDYSDNAIAVIGDTKPIKDQLKSLGGRFNFRLTCGAGWIFSKTKLEQVQSLLMAD